MKNIKLIIGMILVFVAWLFLYTFLHESGHALIAMIYGGHIDKMVLGFNAHVMYSGANFTSFGEVILNLNGALLPVLVVLIALLFYRRDIVNRLYHLCYAIAYISIAGSCLAWVSIPLLSLVTNPPIGDDVTKFMNSSGVHPIIIFLIALGVILLLTVVATKKGLFSSIFKMFGYVKESKPEVKNNMVEKIIIIFSVFAIFVGLFIIFRPSEPVLEYKYEKAVTETNDLLVTSFRAEKTRNYKILLDLKGKGFVTDLRICDEDGKLVYQNTSQTISLETSINLEEGFYHISFKFLLDPEKIDEYFLAMGYDFNPSIVKELSDAYRFNEANNYKVKLSIAVY